MLTRNRGYYLYVSCHANVTVVLWLSLVECVIHLVTGIGFCFCNDICSISPPVDTGLCCFNTCSHSNSNKLRSSSKGQQLRCNQNSLSPFHHNLFRNSRLSAASSRSNIKALDRQVGRSTLVDDFRGGIQGLQMMMELMLISVDYSYHYKTSVGLLSDYLFL